MTLRLFVPSGRGVGFELPGIRVCVHSYSQKPIFLFPGFSPRGRYPYRYDLFHGPAREEGLIGQWWPDPHSDMGLVPLVGRVPDEFARMLFDAIEGVYPELKIQEVT